MYWYLKALGSYGDFSGRAQRAEYWVFTLVNDVIYLALSWLAGRAFPEAIQVTLAIVALVFSLAVFIPSWMVLVRRLHDTNHSGWAMFVVLIPFVGGIILFVWLVRGSDPGENEYGSNPVYVVESRPAAAHPVRRWLLIAGAVAVVSALLVGGFIVVASRGAAEAKALAPWPPATASAESVASLDLSSLGLQRSGRRDARAVYGETFQDGAVIEYAAAGKVAALVAALRFATSGDANAAFNNLEAWAQVSCGESVTSHLAGVGVIHCDFADSQDMILMGDRWILDIEAAALGDVPPAELADRIGAAAAKHWQGLDGGL